MVDNKKAIIFIIILVFNSLFKESLYSDSKLAVPSANTISIISFSEPLQHIRHLLSLLCIKHHIEDKPSISQLNALKTKIENIYQGSLFLIKSERLLRKLDYFKLTYCIGPDKSLGGIMGEPKKALNNIIKEANEDLFLNIKGKSVMYSNQADMLNKAVELENVINSFSENARKRLPNDIFNNEYHVLAGEIYTEYRAVMQRMPERYYGSGKGIISKFWDRRTELMTRDGINDTALSATRLLELEGIVVQSTITNRQYSEALISLYEIVQEDSAQILKMLLERINQIVVLICQLQKQNPDIADSN